MQTYGYEHMLSLHNLEKAGLLKPQTGGRNNYPTIRKTLRLWMDDVNEQVSRTAMSALPVTAHRLMTRVVSRHGCQAFCSWFPAWLRKACFRCCVIALSTGDRRLCKGCVRVRVGECACVCLQLQIRSSWTSPGLVRWPKALS